MDAIDVESLLPPEMADLSTEELVKRLPELDEEMGARALAVSEHVRPWLSNAASRGALQTLCSAHLE
jgi:hypothetical protein